MHPRCCFRSYYKKIWLTVLLRPHNFPKCPLEMIAWRLRSLIPCFVGWSLRNWLVLTGCTIIFRVTLYWKLTREIQHEVNCYETISRPRHRRNHSYDGKVSTVDTSDATVFIILWDTIMHRNFLYIYCYLVLTLLLALVAVVSTL
jgi:hypothetical protein